MTDDPRGIVPRPPALEGEVLEEDMDFGPYKNNESFQMEVEINTKTNQTKILSIRRVPGPKNITPKQLPQGKVSPKG